MAHPENAPSSTPQAGLYFLDPDSRPRGLLEDYELGPIGISDASEGVDFQVWRLDWISDEEAPNYGDFILTPELQGTAATIINVSGVANCGFAFDQNGRPAICWELEAGGSFYYWYDPTIPGFTTTALEAGAWSPRMCLDDHRASQSWTNDVILAYMVGADIYYRQLRDRYTVARLWKAGVGGPLNFLGMTNILRVEYNVGYSDGVTLCQIVGELLETVQIFDYDVSELCEIKVRGYMLSSLASSAEAIRGLQRIYFFDMPEVDGEIYAMLRGQDPVATINRNEIVRGQEVVVETAREQEVEFAKKLHLQYAPAETGYTPTKVTSERSSSNLKLRSEINVETFVNLESAEAAQRADILHKAQFVELQGKVEFGLGENYAWLIDGNVINLEIREDVWKRIRIESHSFQNGFLKFKGKYDRSSVWAYSSAVEPGDNPIELPPSSLAGSTTWEPMDLPALSTEFDSLHWLVSGYGEGAAWTGYQVQREVGGEYVKAADVTTKGTLGLLAATLAAAPREPADLVNTVTVNANKVLESVTDERLLEGANAALVGDEILQFRDVNDLSISTTSNQIQFKSIEAFGIFFDLIRRNDGGSWIADGFQIGDEILVVGSRYNDGTYTLQDVSAQDLELANSTEIVIRDEPEGANVTVRHKLLKLELSHLLRGRLDTSPTAHAIGERFVYLGDPAKISAVSELVGATFNVRAPSFGELPSAATPKSFTFTGESQREWAPIDLVSDLDSGVWTFSWTPRFRLGSPANPIKSLYHYGWRIRITKGATVVDYDVLDPYAPELVLTAAQQTADFGGALTSPFDVDVMGLNEFTGEGRALSGSI